MSKPTILLKVDEALRSKARSGIQRVIVELARTLPNYSTTHLVRWDRLEGHLRPIDRNEFDLLFGRRNWPQGLRPNPAARSTSYRFDSLVDCSGDAWLLNPEVPIHELDGLEIFSRIITQCREYGVRSSAIFYDAIPATNPDYREYNSAFLSYICELGRNDLIFPISHFSNGSLKKLFAEYAPSLLECRSHPISLGEAACPGKVGAQQSPGEQIILVLGTVEPRKRQIELIQAYARARQRSAALAALEVHVVGSLHPAVAERFEHLVRTTPAVHYHRYVNDRVVADLMQRAAFSVFASDDEGFGLPIVESLSAGVPCVCANFGAMAEVADGGGCLTVNVRDQTALEAALLDMAEKRTLRADLREQITRRTFRTWNDYAQILVAALTASPALHPASDAEILDLDGLDLSSSDQVRRIAEADIIIARSAEVRDEAVESVIAEDVDILLPSRWVVGARNAKNEAVAAAAALSLHRSRLDQIAISERRYAHARQALAGQTLNRRVFMRLIISTYNRRDFVIENVRWILKAIHGRSDVELVVLDNASTDGTVDALEKEFGTRLKLFVNSANVGMLGNMRVCSQLYGAEYVWLIGDDDFIVPEQLDSILETLKSNLGVVLGYVNFAVYHRESMGPADRAETFMVEKIPVAPITIETGAYPLRLIAAQHDNLFTAIYLNIWRSDVLAAAYDYPFKGDPFENLVESIPCTKTIIGSFAAADGVWFQPVGIVGNAHNSWVRHRPRWHGRLMAEALALARDSKVDPSILWEWAKVQADLFEEAVSMINSHGLLFNMVEADAYDLSWPLYRRKLTKRVPE